jgi:hypothetical protein
MDAVRARLAADHRVLDDLISRLVHDVDAASHRHLQTAWCDFEHRLLAHLDVEDRLLLPLLQVSHRVEVARSRAEHFRIRALMSALGSAIELRTVSQSAVKALAHLLHAHTAHEDRFLYCHAAERSSVAG